MNRLLIDLAIVINECICWLNDNSMSTPNFLHIQVLPLNSLSHQWSNHISYSYNLSAKHFIFQC